MKSIFYTFAIALTATVLTILVLDFIGVEKATATSFASIIFGGIPFLYQLIDGKINEARGQKEDEFIPLGIFAFSPIKAFLYTLFIAFSIVEGIGALALLVVVAIGDSLEDFLIASGILSMFIVLPLIYFLGVWIGVRSSKYGLVIFIGALFFSRMFSIIFQFSTFEEEDYIAMFEEAPSMVFMAQQLLGGTVVFSIIGATGYWIGRKKRSITYIAYILKKLPEEIVQTITELAYEEAVRYKKRGQITK